MKKSFTKRTISFLSAVILAICMAFPVSAASAVSNEPGVASTENAGGSTVSPMYSSIPGFNAGYISGGYGVVQVTIGKYISTGYLQAAVSSNKNSGSIIVSVKFPNGSIIGLGTMPASGGTTMLKLVYGLAAGTYTFIFEPTNLATFNVQGYIYQ